jgi:hypothetical protein
MKKKTTTRNGGGGNEFLPLFPAAVGVVVVADV